MKRYDEALQELVRVDVNYRFPDWSGKALYEVARVLEAKGDRAGAMEKYRAIMDRFAKDELGAAARKRLFELQAEGAGAAKAPADKPAVVQPPLDKPANQPLKAKKSVKKTDKEQVPAGAGR